MEKIIAKNPTAYHNYTIQNTNSNLTIINGATQADINQQRKDNQTQSDKFT